MSLGRTPTISACLRPPVGFTVRMSRKTGFRCLPLLLAGLLLLSGGCASSSMSGPLAPRAPATLGQRVAVEVDSAPTGALITVNGRLMGQAPLAFNVELDDLGDAAEDITVTADFADSFGRANRNAPAPTVSHTIARGERVTTSITFDTEGVSAR